jgi:hypothetical protein
MTLSNRFDALSDEQQKQFVNIKDEAGLDCFISEHAIVLTEEEKQQVMEYITTGITPLSDDEVEAVAGGNNGKEGGYYYEKAKKDGRNHVIPYGCCLTIGAATVYARHKHPQENGPFGPEDEYIDCACYRCGYYAAKLVLLR